jgi:lipoate-protein ligase A
LFDTDLSEVANALNVKMSKIQSKGHKSVRSRVANISEFIQQKMTISEFRELLLKGLFDENKSFERYHLTEEEWKGVHVLKEKKYDQWDWNFGRSPKFNIQRSKRFPIGEIDLRIFVEKGYITDFKIYGDFFGKEPVSTIENRMQGLRYEREDIRKQLEDFEVKDYFGDISKEEFIELIHGEDENN